MTFLVEREGTRQVDRRLAPPIFPGRENRWVLSFMNEVSRGPLTDSEQSGCSEERDGLERKRERKVSTNRG